MSQGLLLGKPNLAQGKKKVAVEILGWLFFPLTTTASADQSTSWETIHFIIEAVGKLSTE